MITLDKVSKRFAGSEKPAVQELSLDVDDGELVVLVGPSGCGKTTTMRMINRLIEPTSGKILLAGNDISQQDPVELRRGIGYVIQSIGLMPHRTVGENIATVPALVGWDQHRIHDRVRELAGMFSLDEALIDRYPGELSGGQRQRVGVARALAADPPVMLMDEPFAAVDPIVRERLQDQFLDIQANIRKTIVFVTHDIDEAIKLADRIAILNVGGILEQFATPEEILRDPANDFVRDFVGPERGLKRLALVTVSEIEVESGPVVRPDAATSDVEQTMKEFGLPWTSVVDGSGKLLGWIDGSDLHGRDDISGVQAKPFASRVTQHSSLRAALDSIVSSRTQVAVVVDGDGNYVGILSLEAVSKEIVT